MCHRGAACRSRRLYVAKPNAISMTVARIRELSPILRDLENAGKIQIAGCLYDLESGRVRFLKQEPR